MWPNVTGSNDPGHTAPLLMRAAPPHPCALHRRRPSCRMTVHADSEPFGQLQAGVAVNPVLPGIPPVGPAQCTTSRCALDDSDGSRTDPAVGGQRGEQTLDLARIDVVG